MAYKNTRKPNERVVVQVDTGRLVFGTAPDERDRETDEARVFLIGRVVQKRTEAGKEAGEFLDCPIVHGQRVGQLLWDLAFGPVVAPDNKHWYAKELPYAFHTQLLTNGGRLSWWQPVHTLLGGRQAAHDFVVEHLLITDEHGDEYVRYQVTLELVKPDKGKGSPKRPESKPEPAPEPEPAPAVPEPTPEPASPADLARPAPKGTGKARPKKK
jgi:hypothetical protein